MYSRVPLLLFLLCSCLVLNGGNAESASGNNVLVLLDNVAMQQSYSLFFNHLKDGGFKLNFFSADDPSLTLTEYGEYLYDHLIIFAPTVEEFGGLVDVPSILDFIDEGHNVLLAGDSTVSDLSREIASECGIEFDDEGTFVLDHFHNPLSSSSNIGGEGADDTTISVSTSEDTMLQVPVITGKKPLAERKPVLFKGIAHTIKEINGLNVAILRGYDTTYSSNPYEPLKATSTSIIGRNTILLSALQARNNARVVVSGSIQLFSDRFFTSSTDNEYFTSEIAKWCFKERGILRTSNLTHHRLGENEPPPMYRVRDEITYSVVIEEFNGTQWIPFQSPDVQLEFTMLDPYVRTFLKPSSRGTYTATFTVPDVYGVYSFKVNYKQIGYTSLSLKTIQSVRPFRHDEYERFIKTANPYYTSCVSMVVGVFVLFVFLLFTK